MKINASITIGIFFLIASLFNYLGNSTHSAGLIMLGGVGIFCIVSGLFEIKNYQNKNPYLAVTAVIIASSLILTYIQMSSQSYQGNGIIDYIFIVTMPLILILAAYDFTEKWSLFKWKNDG